MKRIAIIGAGISGLTLGRLLKGVYDVTIYESENKPGGLIKCERVQGSLFHMCGGHVFNTKNEEVLNLFWSLFDRDSEFKKSDRHSVIIMTNQQKIPYPIENHAYLLDDETLRAVISDILSLRMESKQADNFADFLQGKFGDTLYNLYFKPYNEKIWKTDLAKIPLAWLDGKLPMPKPEEIVFNNIRRLEEKQFVHSTFWYEKENGSQFIADRLAVGLDVKYGSQIVSLDYSDGNWFVEGEEYDKVIFTGNLRDLPKILRGLDLKQFDKEISELQYHGTTTVFCEIDQNPYSWIYLPDEKYDAHRIICTGNFSASNNARGKMTGTVEFTDYVSIDEIHHQLPLIPLHPRYITHKFNPLTYPIQYNNTRDMVSSLKSYLKQYNLYLCGRFAEWEYFNMDKAMESAMAIVDSLSA